MIESKMAALFCRLVAILASTLIQRSTKAYHNAPRVDLNRVLIAYNAGYDHCKDIDAFSGPESREAAGKACEQAFIALDKFELNNCHGWRYPECRLVSEKDTKYQCSCKIADCDDISVRSHVVTSFRDCATALWTEELNTGVVPAPTADFQQERRNYEEVMQWEELRRFLLSSGEPTTNPEGVQSTFTGSSSGKSTQGANQGTGYQDEANPSYDPPSQSLLVESTEVEHPMSYTCYICRKKFNSQHELREHRKTHPPRKITCEHCGKICPSKSTFKNHMSDFHPGIKIPEPEVPKGAQTIQDTETGRFVCSTCGRSYVHRRALRAHEKSHTTLATYCTYCDRTFANKSAYRNHMRGAHREIAGFLELLNEQREEEKPELCLFCGRTFKDFRGLREHMPYHEGKTRCDICGQVYSRVTALNEHKKFYHPKTTDMKPYK